MNSVYIKKKRDFKYFRILDIGEGKMSIDSDTGANIITALAVILSIFILVFTIIFMIMAMIYSIPINPYYFWIFMLLCFACFAMVGYMYYKAKTEGYENAWIGIVVVIIVGISMFFLILVQVGAYDFLQLLVDLFGS